VKLIQEKLVNTLDHIVIGNNFMDRTLIAQQLRESIDKWDCIKLKSFCTAKKTETAYRMGEKSLPVIHLTGINNQNIQEPQKTSLSKNQQPTK
jgi:hypothetical protein